MGRKADPRPRRVRITRYELPDGSRCASTAPGAKKITTESESYYLHLPGEGRIPLDTTDEAVAWEEVRRILKERHQQRLGISDDRTAQAARPIAEHVQEWVKSVEAGGASRKRVRMLASRMARLVELAGWARITDVKKSSCQTALAKLQAEGHGSGKTQSRGRGSVGRGRGVSAQTRNHYLSGARQFTAWLCDEGRLQADPLAGLKGVSVGGDRRHDRRVPSDEDVRVLFDHLQGGEAPAREGMSGAQRALGYQVCMCAGLRGGELRSLTRESFDLPNGDLILRAGQDKAKRRRLLALPRWLCDKLAAWFEAGGGLWEGFPDGHPGRLLQADLKAARESWLAADVTSEERVRRKASSVCVYEVKGHDGPLYLDFHSWRHWFISAAADLDGMSPAVLMAMSRHVDPKLTLGTYTHARRQGLRDAAEQLPRPGG